MEDKEEKITNCKTKCCKYKSAIFITIGIIIGIIIMVLLNLLNITGNSKIAKIKGKSIKEKEIFNDMKNFYALSFILEKADMTVLDSLYTLNEEQIQEINDNADYYIKTYETYYGYTEEEFLQENGFSSIEEFKDVLKLNYLRDLYYIDYLADNKISEDEINNYYENNIFGAINSKHILVKISEDVSESEALKKANNIIKELNDGATFDEVAEKYKDEVIYEELGYQGYDSDIEESYMTALKELNDESYVAEPVKTSYGYHIIYRIAQQEKPQLEEIKGDIVKILAEELEDEENQKLYNQALLELRDKYNFKICDDEINDVYQKYVDSIKVSDEQ